MSYERKIFGPQSNKTTTLLNPCHLPLYSYKVSISTRNLDGNFDISTVRCKSEINTWQIKKSHPLFSIPFIRFEFSNKKRKNFDARVCGWFLSEPISEVFVYKSWLHRKGWSNFLRKKHNGEEMVRYSFVIPRFRRSRYNKTIILYMWVANSRLLHWKYCLEGFWQSLSVILTLRGWSTCYSTINFILF